MTKIIIDGKELDLPPEYTLLQACEAAGAEIPRFCFHERLSIAGNCRMCLVEVKGGPPKPTASCAMSVRDLRPGPKGEPPVVETNSPMVVKARHGVMEFLLINHPLDCPICDQGGECDLQDQAMAYGVDSSRYRENKRAVEDKYMGALVKTSMNRCIQCTRCVRFATEVAGVSEIGAIGRGEDMEITTYLERALTSELQGNVVDLCPVGALTAKPYQFHARPWELSKTESIDVMDALGSAIRIDARGREVVRILPRINEAINEEWISDKTRHVADGLKTQRLDRPYLRVDGKLAPATWPQAFAAIAAKAKAAGAGRIGAIAGDLASVEEMFALKALMAKLGVVNIDCRQDGSKLDPKFGRASYLFNSTIAGIEQADAIMIIGSNPRLEAPVLNARIRKRWLRGNCLIGVVGERVDLTYPYNYLGAGPESLAEFANHPPADKTHPMFIVGGGALARPDGEAVLSLAAKAALSLGVVKDGWNGFNVLHIRRLPGRRPRSRPDAGAGRADGASDGQGGRGRSVVQSRRRRNRNRSGRVRRLSRHAWRSRRAPRRCRPARRRLSRKDWNLCQYRGAPAIRRARGFSAGRRAGRLGDPARAVRCAGRPTALRLAQPASRRALCRPSPIRPARPGRAGRRRRPRQARGDRRRARQDAFRGRDRRFLPHQPDRPRFPDNGRMLGFGALAPASGRGVAPMSNYGWLWSIGVAALKSVVLLVLLLIYTAYILYGERKIWAAVQLRRGPNVVGPWGLFQSFADLLKFVFKEPIIPAGANKGVFLLAPLVTAILALSAWAVIPLNAGWAIGDINVGILYLFAISSLGVYGIIMAGWSSNSKYPFLAALRSAAQMVSYEVSMGFVIITVLLCAGSLNLSEIVEAQDSRWGLLGWYWLPLLPVFVIFFVSGLAETNRPPFDLVEAESELVAGYAVEYSATPFLLFFLGEYIAILTICAMTTILFLGGWLSPIPFAPFTWIPGVIWFVLKVTFVVFMFAMVKAFVPRYRYDQLMRLGWKVFLPISLFMVVVVAGVLEFRDYLGGAG